jgi:hypothetical protein
MNDAKNRRDVTKWYPAESVNAFVETTGSVGTVAYFIDWTDGVCAHHSQFITLTSHYIHIVECHHT